MGEDRVEGVRSPTVQRHILLESLIGHRKRLGITQQEVAAELDVSVQTVMRLESGQVQLKRDYLSCMTRFYRLPESESERLNALRWGAREPEWWKPYASVLSTDEQQRLGWRSGAQAIQEWACLTVPELLQTRDYATAALLEEPRARRELLVEARLQAQIESTFTRVRQRYVLDEAVVWRRLGGDLVAAGQLDALIGAARAEWVQVRVLPFSADAPLAQEPWSVWEYGSVVAPRLYMPWGERLVADRQRVAAHQERYAALEALCLSSAETVELLRGAREALGVEAGLMPAGT